MWANAGRAGYHAVGRGSTAPTSRNGRWHGLWKDVITEFESCGVWPAHFSRRGVTADLPRCTHHAVRTWRGCVLCVNSGRAPPHATGRSSTAPSPRQFGGTDFEGMWSLHSNSYILIPWRAACAFIAPVKNRPTAHRARAAQSALGTWCGCDAGQRGARSLPRLLPGFGRINAAKWSAAKASEGCGHGV